MHSGSSFDSFGSFAVAPAPHSYYQPPPTTTPIAAAMSHTGVQSTLSPRTQQKGVERSMSPYGRQHQHHHHHQPAYYASASPRSFIGDDDYVGVELPSSTDGPIVVGESSNLHFDPSTHLYGADDSSPYPLMTDRPVDHDEDDDEQGGGGEEEEESLPTTSRFHHPNEYELEEGNTYNSTMPGGESVQQNTWYQPQQQQPHQQSPAPFSQSSHHPTLAVSPAPVTSYPHIHLPPASLPFSPPPHTPPPSSTYTSPQQSPAADSLPPPPPSLPPTSEQEEGRAQTIDQHQAIPPPIQHVAVTAAATATAPTALGVVTSEGEGSRAQMSMPAVTPVAASLSSNGILSGSPPSLHHPSSSSSSRPIVPSPLIIEQPALFAPLPPDTPLSPPRTSRDVARHALAATIAAGTSLTTPRTSRSASKNHHSNMRSSPSSSSASSLSASNPTIHTSDLPTASSSSPAPSSSSSANSIPLPPQPSPSENLLPPALAHLEDEFHTLKEKIRHLRSHHHVHNDDTTISNPTELERLKLSHAREVHDLRLYHESQLESSSERSKDMFLEWWMKIHLKQLQQELEFVQTETTTITPSAAVDNNNSTTAPTLMSPSSSTSIVPSSSSFSSSSSSSLPTVDSLTASLAASQSEVASLRQRLDDVVRGVTETFRPNDGTPTMTIMTPTSGASALSASASSSAPPPPLPPPLHPKEIDFAMKSVNSPLLTSRTSSSRTQSPSRLLSPISTPRDGKPAATTSSSKSVSAVEPSSGLLLALQGLLDTRTLEVEELNRSFENLKLEYHTLQQQSSSTIQELKKERSDHTSTQHALHESRTSLSELTLLLAETRATLAMTQSKVVQLETLVESMKEEYEDTRKKNMKSVKSLKEKEEKYKSEFSFYEKEYLQLQEKFETLLKEREEDTRKFSSELVRMKNESEKQYERYEDEIQLITREASEQVQQHLSNLKEKDLQTSNLLGQTLLDAESNYSSQLSQRESELLESYRQRESELSTSFQQRETELLNHHTKILEELSHETSSKFETLNQHWKMKVIQLKQKERQRLQRFGCQQTIITFRTIVQRRLRQAFKMWLIHTKMSSPSSSSPSFGVTPDVASNTTSSTSFDSNNEHYLQGLIEGLEGEVQPKGILLLRQRALQGENNMKKETTMNQQQQRTSTMNTHQQQQPQPSIDRHARALALLRTRTGSDHSNLIRHNGSFERHTNSSPNSSNGDESPTVAHRSRSRTTVTGEGSIDEDDDALDGDSSPLPSEGRPHPPSSSNPFSRVLILEKFANLCRRQSRQRMVRCFQQWRKIGHTSKKVNNVSSEGRTMATPTNIEFQPPSQTYTDQLHHHQQHESDLSMSTVQLASYEHELLSRQRSDEARRLLLEQEERDIQMETERLMRMREKMKEQREREAMATATSTPNTVAPYASSRSPPLPFHSSGSTLSVSSPLLLASTPPFSFTQQSPIQPHQQQQQQQHAPHAQPYSSTLGDGTNGNTNGITNGSTSVGVIDGPFGPFQRSSASPVLRERQSRPNSLHIPTSPLTTIDRVTMIHRDAGTGVADSDMHGSPAPLLIGATTSPTSFASSPFNSTDIPYNGYSVNRSHSPATRQPAPIDSLSSLSTSIVTNGVPTTPSSHVRPHDDPSSFHASLLAVQEMAAKFLNDRHSSNHSAHSPAPSPAGVLDPSSQRSTIAPISSPSTVASASASSSTNLAPPPASSPLTCSPRSMELRQILLNQQEAALNQNQKHHTNGDGALPRSHSHPSPLLIHTESDSSDSFRNEHHAPLTSPPTPSSSSSSMNKTYTSAAAESLLNRRMHMLAQPPPPPTTNLPGQQKRGKEKLGESNNRIDRHDAPTPLSSSSLYPSLSPSSSSSLLHSTPDRRSARPVHGVGSGLASPLLSRPPPAAFAAMRPTSSSAMKAKGNNNKSPIRNTTHATTTAPKRR